MPEDQGVNGDTWTAEANRLLKAAQWEQIGHSNIDIVDTSNKNRGIDSIFAYEDGFKTSLRRGVFVEAKRWATSSLSEANLHEWILGLSDKITGLKNSPGLLDVYPETKRLELSTGLIACYFHDVENFDGFEPKLSKWLSSLKVRHGTKTRSYHPRVFLLENRRLLRLASTLSAIREWESASKNGEHRSVDFFYPSSSFHGNPVQTITSLSLEYIFSSVIFAKGTSFVEATEATTETNLVFYFGQLDAKSFERLASAIQGANMAEARNELVVYKYLRENDQFRKIKPDVVQMLRNLGAKTVTIVDMNYSDVLPAWVLNEARDS